MADIQVKNDSYAALCDKVRRADPNTQEFRNLMAAKAAAFQKEVVAPKRAARKTAKESVQREWLQRQSPEVQKSFRERGHA